MAEVLGIGCADTEGRETSRSALASGVIANGVLIDMRNGEQTRIMTWAERWAWDRSLRIAVVESPDEALDMLCEAANIAELRSHKFEQEGRQAAGDSWWRVALLFDHAARSLI